MICIRPLAPMTLSAIGLKRDSIEITASTSSGSSPTSSRGAVRGRHHALGGLAGDHEAPRQVGGQRLLRRIRRLGPDRPPTPRPRPARRLAVRRRRGARRPAAPRRSAALRRRRAASGASGLGSHVHAAGGANRSGAVVRAHYRRGMNFLSRVDYTRSLASLHRNRVQPIVVSDYGPYHASVTSEQNPFTKRGFQV